MLERIVRRFVLILVVLMATGLAGSFNTQAGSKSLSLTDAIEKVNWFEGLKTEEKASLKSVAAVRRVKAGEKIIEQGKATKRIMIVLDGKAQVLVDGKEVATLTGQFANAGHG